MPPKVWLTKSAWNGISVPAPATAFRKLGSVLWLCAALVSRSDATPPGFPAEEPKYNPPSGQSFRQWTDRQRYGNIATLAPGANVVVVQSNRTVRVPFIIVSLKDTPVDLQQNKESIINRLKERIFGKPESAVDSLQAYYNQLFEGKLSFFDQSDFISLDLNGKFADYFQAREPTRKLFVDIKESLSQAKVPLEIYNNTQLTGESNDATHARDLLDLAVVFVLARSDQGIWPLRWWYEWTRDGRSPANETSDQVPALPLTDPISHKIIRLSNYCVMPILGPKDQDEVIGYGFLAHEILHAFGLPDLYDRNDYSGGCGGWCCMGWGMYAGVASVAPPWAPKWSAKPTWPSAWCRKFLGVDHQGAFQRWESSEDDVRLVSPLHDQGKMFFRVDLPGQPNPVPQQSLCERYLLIEFRGPGQQKDGTFDWDAQLPGAGFLIWEINERVGRRDPISRQNNVFWPCVYHTRSGFPKEGQNDDSDHPLVGLWRPNSRLASNLDKSAILQGEHLWHQDDQTFRHPAGVILSHFRPNGESGTFHYRVEPVVTPDTPLAAAQSSTATVPQSLPPQSASPPKVVESTGAADTVSRKLSADLNERLENVLKAYPKFDHSITTENDSVRSIKLPANANSKREFAKDILAQVDLLNGKALGDPRARVISATPAPHAKPSQTAMVNLFNGDQTIVKTVGVKIGDKIVRIDGAHVEIQREEKDRDRVRYFISNPVSLPEIPQTLQTAASKSAVAKFLQEHFPGAIPKESGIELVAENGTGKLKWQCRVPTVPTSGPVTIEIDAFDPNGLTDKTAIVIK